MYTKMITGMSLAALIICSAACSKVETVAPIEIPTPAITQPQEKPIQEKPLIQIEGYDCIRLEIGTEYLDCAYKNEDALFLNLQSFLRLCGANEASILCDGTELKVYQEELIDLHTVKGDSYIIVNGRYLYSPIDFVCLRDDVYFPEDVICKMFNVQITAPDMPDTLKADISKICLIQGGEYYYDVTFSGDDIYWLSHIIQAEADTQPIDGMIGVGNVVLNRVSSEQFPNSVFDVIFEYQNTAQFTPKTSTALSRTVSDKVRIATYLCLEGYNTVGHSLFFQNPLLADTSWISQTREFAVRIGDVDFYY